MLIGRKEEQRKLREAFESEYSEFVVVYGRRRVGKTFLVRELFNYKFTFAHTGLAKKSTPFSRICNSGGENISICNAEKQ